MKISALLFATSGIFLQIPVFAQPAIDRHAEIMETMAESLEDSDMTRIDYESLLEDLESLHSNPVNINSATYSDLQKLPFLTDFQIHSLINYRDEQGVLLSLYELQLVHGFSDRLIAQLLPYVRVSGPEPGLSGSIKDIPRYGKGKITVNVRRYMEKAAGYLEDTVSHSRHYPGNPWHYYFKARYDHGEKIGFGISMEKDPGEDFLQGSNQYGFDFNSFHFIVSDIGRLKTCVAGDYRLQFGQGLTLWSGVSPGKSSLPLNIIKRQDPLKRYTSMDENNYFRGIAVSLETGKITFTGYYSSKTIDANITDTLPSGIVSFSSFHESGFHRTSAEITDENSVHELAYGSNISFRGSMIKLGLTWIRYKFDSYLQPSDKLYKAKDFYGSSLVNAGIDYTLSLDNIQMAGEVSYGNNTFATIHKAVFKMNKYASLALLYRYFPASFSSLRSAAFSENSANSNEKGLYMGTIIHPGSHWTVSAYADFYKFPWPRYNANAPSSGSDYLVSAAYTPDTDFEMSLRFRHERNQVNETSESQEIEDLVPARYAGLRYHFSYRLSEALLLRTRFEYVRVRTGRQQADEGYMLYHDVTYSFRIIPVTLYYRYAWFDTDSYRSRIYTYEQQTLPSFTSTPLYDKGYRTYLMLRYNVSNRISFWARLARTCFSDKTTIGSGYDQVTSNTRHEIKLQIVARF